MSHPPDPIHPDGASFPTAREARATAREGEGDGAPGDGAAARLRTGGELLLRCLLPGKPPPLSSFPSPCFLVWISGGSSSSSQQRISDGPAAKVMCWRLGASNPREILLRIRCRSDKLAEVPTDLDFSEIGLARTALRVLMHGAPVDG